MKWKVYKIGPLRSNGTRDFFFEEYGSNKAFKQRKYVPAKNGKWIMNEVVEDPK